MSEKDSSWAFNVEDIRIVGSGIAASTGHIVHAKDIKLIGVVKIDGRTVQVNMVAKEVFFQRQVVCAACKGSTVDRELRPCAVCSARGVRFA